MNGKKIGFWLTTVVVALVMIAGGAADFLLIDEVKAGMDHLGYPYYFARLLGTWKVLGGAAILAPGLSKLKEWAYAGIFFDLSGAFVSHASVGDGIDNLAPPLVLIVLLVASYTLRPQR
ncbi:MAG: DoxX family protein [Myxococcota bacterium]